MTLPRIEGFETPATMASKSQRVEYLVDGMIERGVLALLFGDPGSGKSFLSLDLACSIATGQPWLGRTTQQGSVVYVAGEGYSGIWRRVLAWCKHRGVSPEDVPLYVTPYSYDFLDTEDADFLQRQIAKVPPPVHLIVVDTLARAAPSMNEDRANEVSAFVGVCDNLKDTSGATVLLLHHSPHGDKTRAKGSVALKGACDFEAGLLRTSDSEIVKLTSTKLKDGEPFADTFLRFQSVQMDDGAASAVMVQTNPPPKGRSASGRKFQLTPNDKLFLMVLGAAPVDEDAVRAAFLCGSAWKKDPITGVIGVENGPLISIC